MNILVVGAGAVGGYFGGRLAAAGEQVTFLCRGKTRAAIETAGLRIESVDGDAHVRPACVESPAGFSAADLVIWAVKTYHNEQVIPLVRPLAGPRTAILSLQNGVDAVDDLRAAFGADRVIGGFASIAAEAVKPGVIRHAALGRITLGEMDGPATDRVRAIAGVFDRAAIPNKISTAIRRDLWGKLVWNAAFNPLSVLLQATVERLLMDLSALSILKRAMEEVVGLAQAEGFDLTLKMYERYLDPKQQAGSAPRPPESAAPQVPASLTPAGEFRTSMLQDYCRARPMEIDAISGAVVRRARARRLAVPVNELFYDSLRFLDQEPGRRFPRSTS